MASKICLSHRCGRRQELEYTTLTMLNTVLYIVSRVKQFLWKYLDPICISRLELAPIRVMSNEFKTNPV
jgi:hypothetical protein